MKKVVSISLAGKSYQVEEAGYTLLQNYVESAEKRLKLNPDKDDILADIEQSIADKCAVSFRTGRDVISTQVVEQALEKIGPVEGGKEDDASDDVTTPERARKLYALPKEGKIAGVCAGLAAYFSVDVTIMRLLFVLLIFLTQGFMILVYFAMAIAMPAAKTPEEIAEAHGRPGTAKAIVDKVTQAATDKDMVTKVGAVISLVGRAIVLIFMALLAVGFVGATILWVWALWAIGLGTLEFTDQLAVLNGWRQVVFATALYAMLALPLFALVRFLHRIMNGETESGSMKTNLANSTIVAGVVLATVTVFAFGSTYAPRVQDYVKSHSGYIQVGEYRICADENVCGDGVQYLKAHPESWDENPQIDRRVLQN